MAFDSRSRRIFSELMARPDARVDLAHAGLLIACEEYPDLDVAGYLERFQALAGTAVERAGGSAAPERRLTALAAYLFEEQGFRGNADDYYDPRNSFLNDVLDRRVGIPITLSLVFIEIARRCGLPAEGIGLPGHFIVRVPLGDDARLLDPYHGGLALTLADCQARLDRIFAGRVRLEPPMLLACSPKQILARMLRNLKAIYVKAGDAERALAVVDLLLAVEPESGEDRRDRGLLYAALDCYGLAVQDLEEYVKQAPRAPEAGPLAEQLAELRRRAARLN